MFPTLHCSSPNNQLLHPALGRQSGILSSFSWIEILDSAKVNWITEYGDQFNKLNLFYFSVCQAVGKASLTMTVVDRNSNRMGTGSLPLRPSNSEWGKELPIPNLLKTSNTFHKASISTHGWCLYGWSKLLSCNFLFIYTQTHTHIMWANMSSLEEQLKMLLT